MQEDVGFFGFGGGGGVETIYFLLDDFKNSKINRQAHRQIKKNGTKINKNIAK